MSDGSGEGHPCIILRSRGVHRKLWALGSGSNTTDYQYFEALASGSQHRAISSELEDVTNYE